MRVSHEWDGTGGILSIQGAMAGNSFTNWNKVTPRHNALVQKILQSNCHIISTIRTKTDYTLTEPCNWKHVSEVSLVPLLQVAQPMLLANSVIR